MPQCAVATCRNSHRKTKGRRVRYHRFPAEESVRERWVAVCGRSAIFNTTTARVCSLHFSAPSYERDVEHELLGLPPRSRLRRGAVPDLFVPVAVPSLIKKFNSSPPLPRNYARHTAPQLNGGGLKNFMLKGGKVAKGGGRRSNSGGAARVLLPGMTPPAPPSPLQEEANHYEVLLALGLVPRNNNSWGDIDGQALSSGGVHNRMPVMEGAAAVAPPTVKARSRAASLDAPSSQQNGANARDTEEAVSEGEGVARAAAALVSVKVDVDETAKPLVFRGDGTSTTVKEEPAELAMSSGGASEDEEDGRSRQTGVKRRGAEMSTTGAESNVKRTRRDLEDLLPTDEEDERERMVRTFVESASADGPDEAARCAESLRGEISMLRALADAKEREWNQVIRLRTLKEEMLLRLERRRSVLQMTDSRRGGGSRPRPILPKPAINGAPTSIIGEGRQGPIVDVRSIIADYRSRHPEAVPRRGRRLKPGQTGGGTSPAPAELSELGSLLSEALHRPPTDTSRPSSADSSRSGVPQAEPSISSKDALGSRFSFKDVLVKFAKMSQSEQQQQQPQQTPPRLPYPEVTLHPVSPSPALGPASSLLQGILSKPGSINTPRATNFSPTLARLLTAPERPSPSAGTTAVASSSVSISDLLGPTKGRTEITITPVASQVIKPKPKSSEVAHLETEAGDDDEEDGDEREETGDRLVIDEADPDAPTRQQAQNRRKVTAQVQPRQRQQQPEDGDEEEDDEDVPECQGCHRNQAQFVCAGCGNQWYCSRECQVAAWDEHSEVCTG